MQQKVTVHEIIDEFLLAMEGILSVDTIKWYKSYLGTLDKGFGDTKVDQVTIATLRSLYRDVRNTNITPYSQFNYVRAWRRLFRWAFKEGLIDTNPAQNLKLPRVPQESPKAISKADASSLIKAAAVAGHKRDVAILMFFVDTGARSGGVAGLRLRDLDIDRLRAIVREKGRGGQKERVVFFQEKTAEALQEWIKIRPPSDSDKVFLLTRDGIYQVIKRLAEKSHIKGRWNPHSFRHAFARNLLENGASLGVVSHLMGHKTVDVTIRFYGRFANDELQEFHDRFGWIPDD